MRALPLTIGPFILVPCSIAFSEPNVANGPPSLAFLPLGSAPPRTGSAVCKNTINNLLMDDLRANGRCRILPDTSITFALRKGNVRCEQPIGPDQAKRIGDILEAKFVMWGDYRHEGSIWNVSLKVLSVGTGSAPATVVISSSNVFHLAAKAAGTVLSDIGIAPTEEFKLRMLHAFPASAKASELLSHALLADEQGELLADVEATVREAIVLDPHFAAAHHTMANLLSREGRLEEAADEAFNAVKACPDWSRAHFTLGVIHLYQGHLAQAQKDFLEAARLDSDSTDACMGLGNVYAVRNAWDKVVAIWRKAEELAPYDPSIHASLMFAYAHIGDRTRALSESALATRYEMGEDPTVEHALAGGYVGLGDTAHAVEHYKRFLNNTADPEQQDPKVKEANNYLALVKAQQTVHFVRATPPRLAMHGEFKDRVRRKLPAKEYRSAIDLFASTRAMDRWSEELVGNTQNEQERARQLFEGLMAKFSAGEARGDEAPHTAAEVFHLREDKDVTLSCDDCTRLYVSLARHLGLRAYYVLVEKDCDGRETGHACAGLVLEGRGLLVDPVYGWFGVPHQAYKFLNDLQSTGLFLVERGIAYHDLGEQEAGLELAGDCAMAHFIVAMG